MAAKTRTKRPSHAQYSKERLSKESIEHVILGVHKCVNQWCCDGDLVPCTY